MKDPSERIFMSPLRCNMCDSTLKPPWLSSSETYDPYLWLEGSICILLFFRSLVPGRRLRPPPFYKAWYMSFFPVRRISGWAGRSPWAPFGLFVSCCQLVCWPVDWNMPAVLTLLADWRHTMPSVWFMTSVTRWRSCCETPLPSVSIWGVPECVSFFSLHRGVGVCFDFDPPDARGCFDSHSLSLHRALHWLRLCCFLRPSPRMSSASINSAGLIRACYPVNLPTNCSSH